MQAGVAQEPGRSRRLHRRCGTDGRDKQQSRPGERPTPAGANRAAAWYRQAKETKCGGTGVEKSESADSTVEVGEPAPRGPGGGKRRIGSWTVGRTDGLDTEPTAVSTQVRELSMRACRAARGTDGLDTEPTAVSTSPRRASRFSRRSAWSGSGARPGRSGSRRRTSGCWRRSGQLAERRRKRRWPRPGRCAFRRSDAMVRGAGCPSRARPDLWEPGVGNHPRPPGPSRCRGLHDPDTGDCSCPRWGPPRRHARNIGASGIGGATRANGSRSRFS